MKLIDWERKTNFDNRAIHNGCLF